MELYYEQIKEAADRHHPPTKFKTTKLDFFKIPSLTPIYGFNLKILKAQSTKFSKPVIDAGFDDLQRVFWNYATNVSKYMKPFNVELSGV